MKKLDADAVHALRHTLPGWRFDAARGGCLSRDFVFPDFAQAFAFMTRIALAAEKHNHHPEWSNVYNRVALTWTTHDVQGLSSNDVELATLADHAFGCFNQAAGTPLDQTRCNDN